MITANQRAGRPARYTNPRTGEVVDDPDVRPFDEVLRELGEGMTLSELSEAFWDLIQRVQGTGKAGLLTLEEAFDRIVADVANGVLFGRP